MDPRALPPQIIERMRPADRKALGVLTPEQNAAKAEAQSERELQRLCEQELSRRQIEFLHLSPRAREKAGWPDLVFGLKINVDSYGPIAIACAIELKAKSGKPTQEQLDVLARLHGNGWVSRIINTFDDFIEVLNAKNMSELRHPISR